MLQTGTLGAASLRGISDGKDDLWDSFVMAAPRLRTPSEHDRGSRAWEHQSPDQAAGTDKLGVKWPGILGMSAKGKCENSKIRSLSLSIGLLALASPVSAQDDTSDLTKDLVSANSPLSTLNFQQTYTKYDGDLPGAGDQSSLTTLFQPIFPFPLGDSGTTNLFVRPAFAYVTRQPVFDPATGSFENKSGWADIGYDVAVGRTYESGLQLVAGIQGTIPTDTDVSGGQWRLGPEAVAFKFFENNSFLGAFPSHQWDIGGDDYDYSTTGLELFGGFILDDGWVVYTDSKWSYDWVADQATLPINLTVLKSVKFGNMPFKLKVGVDYFAESNDDFGQDWAVNFQIAPVVPNFINNWFSR